MYNEDQKSRFINEYSQKSSTRTFVTQIFNWFEQYEEEWQCDLSLQTTEILQPVVNELTGVRNKSTEVVLGVLREYVKWCARNNIETSKGIFDVTIDSIDKIRNQMVASPLHLKKILDEYFDQPEQETIDITYRVFVWMAFAGLQDKDAVKVTSADVDFKKFQINYGGESYEIYKEGYVDFEKACKLDEFLFIHENPHYEVPRKRVAGDTIMRGYRSAEINFTSIRPIINKKFSNFEEKQKERQKQQSENEIEVSEEKQRKKGRSQVSGLSYNRIYTSGVFYRMYERERMGEPVNFAAMIQRDVEAKQAEGHYRTTKNKTLRTIVRDIERQYLSDYERWKLAFTK